MLAVPNEKGTGDINAGYRYSHFKSLVEKTEKKLTGKMKSNLLDMNNLMNLDCSCKFKRLFVNAIEQPISELQ